MVLIECNFQSIIGGTIPGYRVPFKLKGTINKAIFGGSGECQSRYLFVGPLPVLKQKAFRFVDGTFQKSLRYLLQTI